MAARNGPTRTIPEYYPQFVRVGPPPLAVEAWQGLIKPFTGCNRDQLLLLLDDLAVGAQVHVGAGRLHHDPNCGRTHGPVGYASQLSHPQDEAFLIRLVVPPTPRHPKAIAVYPEISAARFSKHPHLFQAMPRLGLPEFPACEPDALCVYRPGDGEWSWRTADLVLFLDYVAIYLAKHVVWVSTGADHGGLWIGPQASHQPEDLIKELDPFGECRCGSGASYGSCCRSFDLYRTDLTRKATAFVNAMKTNPRRPAA